MAIIKLLTIITSNVHELNSPIKRHRMAEQIQEQGTTKVINYQQGTHFGSKDTHRLKEKIWKKIFHANYNQKTA